MNAADHKVAAEAQITKAKAMLDQVEPLAGANATEYVAVRNFLILLQATIAVGEVHARLAAIVDPVHY